MNETSMLHTPPERKGDPLWPENLGLTLQDDGGAVLRAEYAYEIGRDHDGDPVFHQIIDLDPVACKQFVAHWVHKNLPRLTGLLELLKEDQ